MSTRAAGNPATTTTGTPGPAPTPGPASPLTPADATDTSNRIGHLHADLHGVGDTRTDVGGVVGHHTDLDPSGDTGTGTPTRTRTGNGPGDVGRESDSDGDTGTATSGTGNASGDADPESDRRDDTEVADRGIWGGRRGERVALAAVAGVALVLNSWGLGRNGLGNQYYAAATRSMTESWHNFLFAAFDPGGFISVDKPPVALWIQALSARLFGVNTWSLLLPSALAGAGAVALLWVTVRRRFGPTAATIAGLVLALSPVSVAVNRLNIPEPFLILFLVAAAWAIDRSLDARRWWRWLVLAGAFVGLAFNTKMLAAYVPVPALMLGVALGAAGAVRAASRRLPRAAAQAALRTAVFAASSLAFSLPWLLMVQLWPASSRPYVGGSRDDSVLDLVFGYNGIRRVDGGLDSGARLLGGFASAGGVIGGLPGPLRLFGDAVGGQIAWLLPVAALALVAAVWLHRHDGSRRAMLALWAGWLLVPGVVFSYASGTFHSYYVSLMVPGLAAVVGIGLGALLPLLRRSPGWLVAAGATVAGTVSLQWGLSGRQPDFYGWTRVLVALVAVLAATVVVVGLWHRRGRLLVGGLALALAGALVTPAAWAASETGNAVLNATLPQAGPRSGSAGSTFGSASSNGDPELGAFLRSQGGERTWDLVTASAQTASGLIADEDVSVLALGGFMGSDPAVDLDRFADLVADGEIGLVLVEDGGFGGAGSGSPFGGGSGFGSGSSGMGARPGTDAATVLDAVAATCTPVTDASLPTAYANALYDCTDHADALATAD